MKGLTCSLALRWSLKEEIPLGGCCPSPGVIEQTYLNLNQLEPNLQSVIEHPAELILDQENPRAHECEHKCLLLEATEFGGWFVSQRYYGNSCSTSPELRPEKEPRAGTWKILPPLWPCERGTGGGDAALALRKLQEARQIQGGPPVSGDIMTSL